MPVFGMLAQIIFIRVIRPGKARGVKSIIEGDMGVYGIAVLGFFSCGISVIWILTCGIAVSSGLAVCGSMRFICSRQRYEC